MKVQKSIITLCMLASVSATAESANPQWSGFYIGANTGIVRGETHLRVLDADPSFYPDYDGGELIKNNHLNGGFAGAEIGYYIQHQHWVYGLFASTRAMHANDIKWSIDACCGTGDDRIRTTLSNISVVGGRVGYALDDILLYMGAGAAFGKVKISVNDANVDRNGVAQTSFTGRGSDSKWLRGYALNAGAEYALNDAWRVGLDYLYAAFQHTTFDASGISFDATGSPQGKAAYTLEPKGFDSHLFSLTFIYTF